MDHAVKLQPRKVDSLALVTDVLRLRDRVPGRIFYVPDSLSRLVYPEEAKKHAEVHHEIPFFGKVAEYISSQSLVVTRAGITRIVTNV